jgi:hypothetical protein
LAPEGSLRLLITCSHLRIFHVLELPGTQPWVLTPSTSGISHQPGTTKLFHGHHLQCARLRSLRGSPYSFPAHRCVDLRLWRRLGALRRAVHG